MNEQLQDRYVSVGVSKPTAQINEQLRCHVCYRHFSTTKALSDHVSSYQLEAQQLIARLLEIQAHLPRLHKNDADDADDNDSSSYDDDDDDDDENDGGDDNNGNEVVDVSPPGSALDHSEKDRTKRQCPYPNCHRKMRFKRRNDLVRHYETHIRCYEICVFCRDTFTWLRKYIRHKCSIRKRKSDEANEFYRKERCKQLRRSAIHSLNTMLNEQGSLAGRHTKRRVEIRDGSLESHQPSKKHISNAGTSTARTLQANDDLEPKTSVAISLEGTKMPMPTNGLSGGQHSFYSLTQGAEMFAPIFEDFTIPPYHRPLQTVPPLPPPQQQQQQMMFPFPSHAVHEGYQTIQPLETSSGGFLIESQREFDNQ
ncbi:hypothetical protein RBB50_012626 [Rhinocladiella similis]